MQLALGAVATRAVAVVPRFAGLVTDTNATDVLVDVGAAAGAELVLAPDVGTVDVVATAGLVDDSDTADGTAVPLQATMSSPNAALLIGRACSGIRQISRPGILLRARRAVRVGTPDAIALTSRDVPAAE